MNNDLNIDACSACTARHGMNNINAVNDCCYNTCAAFVDGDISDVINSPCGQNCKRCIQNSLACKGKTSCGKNLAVPTIPSRPQNFKSCLEQTDDTKSALGCCMQRCNDSECQEHCIDAYNSLVMVREGFVFGMGVNRGLLFLCSVILFHSLVILGKIRLPMQRTKALLSIVAVYTIMYYLVMHVL